jgi:ACR3 family arsenite efflux pump ArsB
MVLLAPCTDWFATFTRLGGGDVRRAVALIPILLIAQLALLPFYLPLVARDVELDRLDLDPFVNAFLAVIVLPLMLALVTRVLLPERFEARWERIVARGTPILLAVTLFLVAAGQAPAVRDAGTEMLSAGVVFVAYALLALWLARMVARTVSLDQRARRTLAFSLGTRNSFVVLPLALALPAHLAAAAAVVALQSLIELGAMIVYLHAVPNIAFPDSGFEEE